MPGHLDILIVQGETFELPLTYKVNGALVNLTGYHARMQVRQKHAAETAIVSLTDGDGITLGGPAATIVPLISDEDTAALQFDNPAYWDLELESPAGKVKRLLEGRATLSPEVTREDES